MQALHGSETEEEDSYGEQLQMQNSQTKETGMDQQFQGFNQGRDPSRKFELTLGTFQ